MRTIKRNIIIPEWANWIAQNQIGDWYAYEFVPVIGEYGWDSPDGKDARLFEGPVYEKWQNTLARV